MSGGYCVAGESARDHTNTRADRYPVWSPDGTEIALLAVRGYPAGEKRRALLVMNADGSDAPEVGRALGDQRLSNFDCRKVSVREFGLEVVRA